VHGDARRDVQGHRFLFSPDRRYTAPDPGVDDLRRLHDRLGLERAPHPLRRRPGGPVADFAPDPTLGDRILVDNPERLYFDL
jgi:hypothetical protein